jgi:hypothetical protein
MEEVKVLVVKVVVALIKLNNRLFLTLRFT